MKPLVSVAMLCLALAGAASAAATAPRTHVNPLLAPSTLPYQAPDFARIRVSDYEPAIEAGMKQHLAEIQAITANPQPPTFANTIVAVERSGQRLGYAWNVFSAVIGADASPTLQRVRARESPRLAAHRDAIWMNAALFSRVDTLWKQRASLGLDAQDAYLLERLHRRFVRAGAALSRAGQDTLRALNQREAALGAAFADQLLAETNASALVVPGRAQLAGLGPADLAAAASLAKSRGLAGRWVLALQNTTQQPLLASLTGRATRQRLLAASEARGGRGGPHDTRAIVTELARLRARRAQLLGYANYATFALEERMARTPTAVMKFLEDIVPAATAQAATDAAHLQAQVDAERGGFALGAADWSYYAEQVRRAEYDYDPATVQPYLELDRVLRDGVFYAATQLYGITFHERKDIPVYHPDVRVWEVRDADGTPLALFYGDYFARPSKSGGAWEDEFVSRNQLRGTRAVMFNVTNITRPAAGQPALLTFDEVTTLFHEFGHALHSMFNDPRYPTLGSVPPDFGEVPSQFNEHWALDPAVLAHYARNWRTGAPMPDSLVARIRRAQTFDQGYATTEYLSASLLDMAWHTLEPQDSIGDVAAFEASALRRARVDMPQVPPRYHTPYFAHIWGSEYAAGYYGYLWSQMIEDDAYAWFGEHGGLTRENGQRFRDQILERAGTLDPAQMYREFRGRDPEPGPFLEELGLAPAK